MKAILALLLGLIYQSYADSVVLEFESPDSDEAQSAGDEAQSFGGLIIQVRQGDDEAPTIALGSDIDDYDDVYCLNFLGLFEASEYDTTTRTSADYTAIEGTRLDFADANCTTRQEASTATATVFSIQCTDVGEATLTLTFTFVQDEDGDYGLEYIINLRDYTLSSSTAKLVMVQSLEECGDTIDLDAAEASTSTTDEPEETEVEDEDDPESTDVPTRRRLLDDMGSSTTDEPEETEPTETQSAEGTESVENDAESLEEEDGISEDDSGEFDAGFARFVVNGQALDSCEDGNTEIDSTLVHQPEDGELHIVFDSFSCTLILDPFYGLDDSKYQQVYNENDVVTDPSPQTTEDNAGSYGIMIAMVIGLFAYLW